MNKVIIISLILIALLFAGCNKTPVDDTSLIIINKQNNATATEISSAELIPVATNTLSPPVTLPIPTIALLTATPTAIVTSSPPPSLTPILPIIITAIPDDVGITREGGDLSISAESIFVYPVPQLYTGDMTTFHIRANVPDIVNPNEVFVDIYVDDQLIVNNINIGGYTNLNGDPIGLYQWVWQPSEAGNYQVRVELDPDDRVLQGDEDLDNNRVQFTLDVLPRASLPAVQQNAQWDMIETSYARIHLVTGTAADRDRAYLHATVDAAMLEAANTLGVPPIADHKIEFYFIDRVIGQGGYAGSSIVISYLDRNYAGGGLYEVLVHESIHVLDTPLESDARVTFLVEGIAIWGTGGHYKPENIEARAAGLLLDTDFYIPLAQLINNFYPSQHEVGYLEAGAFLSYLSMTYGAEKVYALYGNTQHRIGRTTAESFSDDLVIYFGKTLEQLESDWQHYLQSVPRRAEDALDLVLTIEYYNLMREYQQIYDPTAYYLYAWLPYPDSLREQNLTADLTRHPEEPINIALEAMLESADVALRNGELARTRVLLDSVQRVIDNGGQFIDPLAASYFDLVQKSAELGFIVQNISIFNDTIGAKAIIVATDPSTNELVTLTLALDGVDWTVSQ